MKIHLLFLYLLIFTAPLFAQTKSKGAVTPQADPFSAANNFDVDLYNKALSFGDYEVAKNALFHLIVRNPDSLNFLDSLVTLYFSLGQMPQCIFAGTQYMERDSNNLSVMEMVALSYGQLGKNKESLDLYEQMLRRTSNIYYAYQTAVQQFYLKRIGECNQTIDLILKDPRSETEKIAINVDQSTQQQVPLKAAAYNMRGIIFKEMNQPAEAREAFEASLKVMPDFSLAKGNLEMLDKPAEGQKDAPSGPTLKK